MIKLTDRYDQYAYAVAVKMDDSLVANDATFEEGSWVAPGPNGYVRPAAGAKAFMLISSKRSGRDQFSGKAAAPAEIYVGPFALATDQFDTSATFEAGTALKVNTNGKLTPQGGTGVIVAYATGPVNGNFLPIVSA